MWVRRERAVERALRAILRGRGSPFLGRVRCVVVRYRSLLFYRRILSRGGQRRDDNQRKGKSKIASHDNFLPVTHYGTKLDILDHEQRVSTAQQNGGNYEGQDDIGRLRPLARGTGNSRKG